MLNNFQFSISINSYTPLTLDGEKIKEMAKDSLANNIKLLKVKNSSIETVKTQSLMIGKIDALIAQYNKIMELFFNLDYSDRFFVFKWIYSLLYSNRGFISGVKLDKEVFNDVAKSVKAVDFEDIEDSVLSKALPDLATIVKQLLEGVEIPELNEAPIFENEFMHVTSSAGPNGSPALLTLPLDAQALVNNPKLMTSIEKLGSHFGITKVSESISNMSQTKFPTDIPDVTDQIKKSAANPVDSKLFIFSEPGGKWRIVAEVDGFSQTVLNPIHELLSKISRNLNHISAHYNQTKSFEELYNQALKTGFMGTFDLEKATDLFYIKLQSFCLEEILKQAYGIEGASKDWENVISKDRKFVVNKFEEEEKLTYKLGQPMGAKSSWVIMHLTLIILAKQAEINCLKIDPNFNKIDHYSICGDDCDFTDQMIYNEFNKLIDLLKLQINRTKSYSTDCKGNKNLLFGEYLKKVVYQDEIVIPFSGRSGGKFFNQPKQQIFNYTKSMLMMDLDFCGTDLINYAFNKDQTYFMNQEEGEYSGVSVTPYLVNMCEQMYYWLLMTESMGGLNLPLDKFDLVFRDQEIFGALKNINCYIDPSVNVQCKLIENSIRTNHHRALRKGDNAILSVFNKTGLSAINASITKTLITKGPVEIDWEGLQDEFKDLFASTLLNDYPIFRVIIKITIEQRARLMLFIENQKEYLDKNSKDPSTSNYTASDLAVLESMLFKSRKETQLLDMYFVIVPQVEENLSEINPISRSKLSSYKNIGYLENKIVNERELSQLSNDLWNL